MQSTVWTRAHRRTFRGLWLVLLLALLISPFNAPPPIANAQKFQVLVPYGFVAEPVASGLSLPTSFAFAPGNRIYVTEKSGVVRVIREGVLQPAPFIDLRSQVNDYDQRGMMGIATHPNFAASPYVYLAFVYEPPEAAGHDRSGARVSRLIRVNANPSNFDVAVPGSEVVIVGTNSTFANIGNPDRGDKKPYSCQDGAGTPVRDCVPEEGTAHQINHMAFGSDGSLYVSVGDGINYSDGSLRAQEIDRLSGKVLRINPLTGAGYPNNPFYDGDPNSNRSKVWLLGMRNPFRISIQPGSGNVTVAEVGNNKWEEVTIAPRGSNLGWPCIEGPVPNAYDPICQPLLSGQTAVLTPTYSFPHTKGRGATIGGDWVVNPAWPASYRGAYLFADFNVGVVYIMTLDRAGVPTVAEFLTVIPSPVQVGFGADGHLYILSVAVGLHRVRWVGGNAVVPLPKPTTAKGAGGVALPTATPQPGSTPTPVVAGAPAESAGGGVPESRNANPNIGVNQRVKVRKEFSVTVRSKPGESAGREVGVIGGGEQAIVLGGPELLPGQGDSVVWWYVRSDNGVEGWVPANNADISLLQPMQ